MMGTLKYSNIFLLNRLANGYSLCMATSSTSWDHCCAIVVWNDVARSPPLMANFHTQLIIVSPRVCKKGTSTPLAGRNMWWFSSENAAAHRATLGRVSNLVYIISELVCHLFATFCNQCLLCVCVCVRAEIAWLFALSVRADFLVTSLVLPACLRYVNLNVQTGSI